MNSKFYSKLLIVFGLVALCGLFAPAQGSEYWFPHMVDGNAGDYLFGTEFYFNNVQNTPTVVTLYFITETGTPWTVDLRSVDRGDADGTLSSTTFTLEPWETANFYTGGVGALAVGWAWVWASQPVSVSSSFTFYDDRTSPMSVVWTAGVLPSPVGTQFSFAANVSPGGDVATGTQVDMGFAIGNPGGPNAAIVATLLDRFGNQLSAKTINLGPGYHYSRFMSELFNDVNFGNQFHGTIRLNSNVNITVVALKHVSNAYSDRYSTLAVQPDAMYRANITYDWEDNFGFDAALPITAPVEIIGTSNSWDDNTDSDVFSIDLTAGQVLYVFVMADAIGSPLDDTLQIFDPSHVSVAYNDDGLDGLLDPFLRYQAPSSGTYFISRGSIGGTSSRESFYRMFVRVK
jgi:hypothetical protein